MVEPYLYLLHHYFYFLNFWNDVNEVYDAFCDVYHYYHHCLDVYLYALPFFLCRLCYAYDDAFILLISKYFMQQNH